MFARFGQLLIATAWLIACVVSNELEKKFEVGFVGMPHSWFLLSIMILAVGTSDTLSFDLSIGMTILLWWGTWYKLKSNDYNEENSANVYNVALLLLSFTSVGLPLLFIEDLRIKEKLSARKEPSKADQAMLSQA